MYEYTTIMEGYKMYKKYNNIYQGCDEEGGIVDDDGISSHNCDGGGGTIDDDIWSHSCDGGVDTKDGEISGLYL